MTNLHETDRLVERLRTDGERLAVAYDWANDPDATLITIDKEVVFDATCRMDEAADALTAMGGKAGPAATITELGEVMASDPAELRALFDAMPEEPHGGIKCLDVYASPVQARTGEVTGAMVERACVGYWPSHWAQQMPETDKTSIRVHMRAALEAALSEPPKA